MTSSASKFLISFALVLGIGCALGYKYDQKSKKQLECKRKKRLSKRMSKESIVESTTEGVIEQREAVIEEMQQPLADKMEQSVIEQGEESVTEKMEQSVIEEMEQREPPITEQLDSPIIPVEKTRTVNMSYSEATSHTIPPSKEIYRVFPVDEQPDQQEAVPELTPSRTTAHSSIPSTPSSAEPCTPKTLEFIDSPPSSSLNVHAAEFIPGQSFTEQKPPHRSVQKKPSFLVYRQTTLGDFIEVGSTGSKRKSMNFKKKVCMYGANCTNKEHCVYAHPTDMCR
jgi:hypothetical protein